MKSVKRIAIDPRFRFSYASYYIAGLYKCYSGKVLFKVVDHTLKLNEIEDYRCGFALVVSYSDDLEKRIFVDTSDHNRIYEQFYEWADVYAKINVKQIDIDRPKLLLIGPSFGIRVWNPVKTMWMCMCNYLKLRKMNDDKYRVSLNVYFKDYLYSIIRRLPLSAYNSDFDCPEEDYIFTLNTLWYDPLTDSLTNKFRGAYVRACQKLFPRFEGGFRIVDQPTVIEEFPKYKEYYTEFADIITSQRVCLNEYLQKTYRSQVVFNVPSVSGCHGWKLAEYFAMGKIIISMPLINIIPDYERFKTCVFWVHNEEEIEQAIVQLKSSPQQREQLRKNVLRYYNDYLSPESVVKSILNA